MCHRQRSCLKNEDVKELLRLELRNRCTKTVDLNNVLIINVLMVMSSLMISLEINPLPGAKQNPGLISEKAETRAS